MLELIPLPCAAKLELLRTESFIKRRKQFETESTGEISMSDSFSPEDCSVDHTVMVNKVPTDYRGQPTGRNSSKDPGISTTHASRHVFSNSRVQPRASSSNHSRSATGSGSRDQKNWSHDRTNMSSRSHNRDVKSHDHMLLSKRKRSRDSEEDSGMWTEHVSSSGRVYYYNKVEDKSQWEKPKGFTKKYKEDLSSPNSRGSRSSSSLSAISSKLAPRHMTATPSSTHPHKDVGNHRDSLSQFKSRHDLHHSAHRGERRDKEQSSSRPLSRQGSHSRSQSRSLSPPSASRPSGTAHVSSRHWRTGSEKQVSDKTPSRHYSKPSHSVTTSRLVTSPLTPKTTNPMSSALVSPTTPVSIPSTFSHAISTTQQIIDQTSILIEKQRVLINRNGEPHTSSRYLQQWQGDVISLEHTPPVQQSYARHRLDFTPVNGPSTPEIAVSSSSVLSPQTAGVMDTTGLHPLQRALLLQNQFTQQQQQGYDPSHPVTPQSAIPTYLSQQTSHPSSPLIHSPIRQLRLTETQSMIHTPPGAQSNVFTMPLAVSGRYSQTMSGQGMQVAPAELSLLQSPMSRLMGKMDNSSFPDVAVLTSLPQGSLTVDLDLIDKSLAECWTGHNEPLQSRIDGCVRDSLQVGLTGPIPLSSRVTADRLRLENRQLIVASSNMRLKAMNSLMDEINSR